MASQQTPNYRLSRWAGTDRILVEEFNDNWDKIDTALKGNAEAMAAETAAREAASSLVKLMTATLDSDTLNWQIDVSGIDLTQYAKLLIYPYINTQNNQPVYLRVNGINSGYSQNYRAESTSNLTDIPSNYGGNNRFGIREVTLIQRLPAVYTFMPSPSMNDSYQYVIGRTPNLEAGVTHLNTLDFCLDNGSAPLEAGSKVHIFGLKL